jgi:hypothetical protein
MKKLFSGIDVETWLIGYLSQRTKWAMLQNIFKQRGGWEDWLQVEFVKVSVLSECVGNSRSERPSFARRAHLTKASCCDYC